MRPDYRHGLRGLGKKNAHLIGDRSEHRSKLSRLIGIVNLTAELTDDVALRVDLVLHVTLLGCAELLDHRSLEVRDGIGERVGLVQRSKLTLITLLGHQLLHVAAALTQLGSEIGIARLDSVLDLKSGHAGLGSKSGDAVTDTLNTGIDEIEILTERVSKVLDSGTGSLAIRVDGVHQEFATGIVVHLVGKESGTGITAEATVTEAAKAAPATTEGKTEKESYDSATPAISSEESPVILGSVDISRICHSKIDFDC